MRARHWSAFLAAMAGAAVLSAAAAHAAFPSKPVEIVVPFSAGGSTDLSARILADALQAKWGVPVKVVNKPGGNTVPAVDGVRRAATDGHTVLMDGSPSSSLLAVAVKDLPFPVTDRTFITLTTQTAMILVVSQNSPLKSLKDLIARVKSEPSTFTWTSLGGTGTIDMAFRQMFKAVGVDVANTRAVVLKGGSDAATQTAGGHVMAGAGSYSSVSTFLKAGKLRAISIAAPERSRIMPDVPTTKEGGFPGIRVIQWNGFSGPPGLDPDAVKRWRETVQEVLKDEKVIAAHARLGMEPYAGDGEVMRKQVVSDIDDLKTLFK